MPADLLQRAWDALPDTAHRVPRHTSREANARLMDDIEASVRAHARAPSRIDARLAELDREWDMERSLEANFAVVSLLGAGLAVFDRRFLALTGIAAAFMVQHALQGWCPPASAFRRRGVRTAREIDTERTALKALRGDFEDTRAGRFEDADRAARDALAAAWR